MAANRAKLAAASSKKKTLTLIKPIQLISLGLWMVLLGFTLSGVTTRLASYGIKPYSLTYLGLNTLE